MGHNNSGIGSCDKFSHPREQLDQFLRWFLNSQEPLVQVLRIKTKTRCGIRIGQHWLWPKNKIKFKLPKWLLTIILTFWKAKNHQLRTVIWHYKDLFKGNNFAFESLWIGVYMWEAYHIGKISSRVITLPLKACELEFICKRHKLVK